MCLRLVHFKNGDICMEFLNVETKARMDHLRLLFKSRPESVADVFLLLHSRKATPFWMGLERTAVRLPIPMRS